MYGSTLSANKQPQDCSPEKYSEEPISPRVLELTIEEMVQANRLLNNSETLHHIINLNRQMTDGRRLNLFEQKLVDKFIDNFNIQYKSPLADALKEE